MGSEEQFRECMRKCLEECIEKAYKDAEPVLEVLEWLRINTTSIVCRVTCETYCKEKCRGGG